MAFPKFSQLLYERKWDEAKKMLDKINLHEVNIVNQTPLFDACALGAVDIAKEMIKRGADYRHVDFNNNTPLRVALRDLKAARELYYFISEWVISSDRVRTEIQQAIDFMLEDTRDKVRKALPILLENMVDAPTFKEALLKPSLPPEVYKVLGHSKELGRIKRWNRKKVWKLAEVLHLGINPPMPYKRREDKKKALDLALLLPTYSWVEAAQESLEKASSIEEAYKLAMENYGKKVLGIELAPIVENLEAHYSVHLVVNVLAWLPVLRYINPRYIRVFQAFFSLPPKLFQERRYEGSPIPFLEEWKENYKREIEIKSHPITIPKHLQARAMEYLPEITQPLTYDLYHRLKKRIDKVVAPQNPLLAYALRDFLEKVAPELLPGNKIIFEISDNLEMVFTQGNTPWIQTCLDPFHPENYKLGLLGISVNSAIRTAFLYDGKEVIGRRRLLVVRDKEGKIQILVDRYKGMAALQSVMDEELKKILERWKEKGYIDEYGERMEGTLMPPIRAPYYVDNPFNHHVGLFFPTPVDQR
ncbi:MAG: ankyrin repeat domain-containing protein [Candidatus Micrarchaeota archaeon]|nr:ankyrin repeat domain-containing protein [Candidatus Micrarchaeota archaeon]